MIDPALLDVACPICPAEPLELCTVGGRFMESTVHYPRRTAADVPLEVEPEPKPPREPRTRKPPRPRKVRSTRPKGPRTHCANGHEYTEANTHLQKNGQRRCRACGTASKRRQREAAGIGPREPLTHCKNGHEYTPENTYTTAGSRRCRTCKRARDAISNAKRRATK